MHLRFIVFLLFLSFFASCKKETVDTPVPISSNHVKFFGFTLVDTYWDDPTDSIQKSNYADEVHSFSNMADILVVNPTDDLTQRISNLADLDMCSVLHLNELFFEQVGTTSPSGADYDLRVDYQQRWDQFVSVNQLMKEPGNICCFYIGEEPTWNGISFDELNSASNYVKAQFPDVPIMMVEAYPILDSLQVPTSVDWLGFDHYFIKDPTTNPEFQSEWSTILSKRSRPDQKMVLIMDSHYIPWAHGDFGNIELDEMKDVASNYYQLGLSEPSVIAILGYHWPSGFEFSETIGARSMPLSVQDEYKRIGKEITGKN